MKLTASQEAAVRQRGSSLLLSASAGSGKTGVLTCRVVDLLADAGDPCDVDQVLVVTFTRAAAAELRGRIADQLQKRAEACDDPRAAARLERQVLLLDTAEIGTIDAWCGRLVREHFELLDVDPSFGVLSAEQAALLRREAMDDLFSSLYRGGSPEARQVHEWLEAQLSPQDDFLRELILELNSFRAHLLSPGSWLDARRSQWSRPNEELIADERRLLVGYVGDELRGQRERLAALLGTIADPAIRKALDAYASALRNWSVALSRDADLPRILGGIAEFRFARTSTGSPDRPALDEVKRWYESRLRKRWTPEAATAIPDVVPVIGRRLRTLLFCEQAFEDRLSQLKRRQHACEFADVQRMALDLLGRATADGRLEPTETALRLRQRYQHILVDEYQDTSPMQAALLGLVTREAPQAANRFMVGDIKQSIYSFRLAEPRLFIEQARAFDQHREAGETHCLADNFRSHPTLLAALNGVFQRLFEVDFGGSAYREQERLRGCREDIANPVLDSAARLEVHLLTAPSSSSEDSGDESASGDDEERLLERIEREARVIAGRIDEFREQELKIPERAPDGKLRLRPLRMDDVVVLLRSAKETAPRLADALRKLGVPAAADGRESLLDALEVGDLRFGLALVANLRQDLPLAAYLRGPMVGLVEPELAALRAASSGPFWAAVLRFARSGADEPLRARVRAALARIRRWRTLARQYDVAAVLRHVLADAGLRGFVQALPGAPQRLALLDALHGLAADASAGGRQGVSDFVEFLDALAEEDLRPASGAAPAADRVRVMTIHAAKGLEFPIVFLANAGARFNRPVGMRGLICDAELGLSIRAVDRVLRRRIESFSWPAARDRAVARLTDEELRLLYVAATRARELLCVVGHVEDRFLTSVLPRWQGADVPPRIARESAQSALQWLLLAIQAGKLEPSGEAHVVQAEDKPPTAAPRRDEAPSARWSKSDEQWVRRGQALLAARLDVSLAARPAVVSVSTLKQRRAEALAAEEAAVVFRPAPAASPRFARETSVDGRAFGTAVHRFLQHADLSRLENAGGVRAEAERLVAAGRLAPDAASQLPVEDIAWFAASPLGVELRCAAGELRREVAFACGLPGDSDEPTLLRGVLDGVVDRPDGLLLVDYKTDRPRDANDRAARDRSYGLQLQLYAVAAAAAFGRPVRRAVLIYLCERRCVDVAIDPRTLSRATSLVDNEPALRQAGEDRWTC